MCINIIENVPEHRQKETISNQWIWRITRETSKKTENELIKILNEIFLILSDSYEYFVYGRKDTQIFWFNYVKEVDQKIEEALKKGIKNSLVEFYMVIGDPDKKIQPTAIFTISAILER